MNSSAQSISMIGDAVSGWSTDVQMSTTDNVNFTLSNFTFSNGGAKFRQDAGWNTNWGSNAFPSGTATLNGGNIQVIAGVYNVAFNISTRAFSFSAVPMGFDAISISGTAGPGLNADVAMLTVDGINYSLNNCALTAGTLLFRKNNSSEITWGSASFPSGTATQGGSAMVVSPGTYDIKFNKTTGAYSFVFAKIGIIGSATPGGWDSDTLLSTTDGVNYTLEGVTLTTGELKFRQNEAWTVNWGASAFPVGTATLNSGNIPVTAGTYSVSFNKYTGAFSFSAGYPVISLTSGNATIDLITLNGENYYVNNYSITAGNYLFTQSGNNNSWGPISFPSGTATLGGVSIPVLAGDYNITFNRNTGVFSFNYLTISLIGSATPGGWSADTNLNSTDGVNYTLSGLALIVGELKFRQGNDWGVSWGSTSFPGGIADNGSNIAVTTASNFTVNFNRITGVFYFYDELNLQVTTPVNYCKGATAASLSLSVNAVPGSVVKWYNLGGTINNPTYTFISTGAPRPTTTVIGAKTYYVSQTIGGIEGTKTAIVVNVFGVPTAPTTLTGTAAQGPLVGTTTEAIYTTTAVAGATSYLWAVPTGVNLISGQGTTSVTVNFADVTAGAGAIGLITVKSVNENGCHSATAKSLALTKALPATPTALVMTNGITATAVTKISEYVGHTTVFTLTATAATATSFNWTLPQGVNQISGGNTNVITVNFSGVNSGVGTTAISVNAVNGVGTSATAKSLSLTRALPTAPSTLVLTNGVTSTAITDVSKFIGTTTELTLKATAAATAAANSFEWNLPTGVNQISGGTSNIITINFAGFSGPDLTSIILSVKSVNGVGSSATAKALTVTRKLPAVVSVVTGQIAGICANSSVNYTITAPAGALSYNITVPVGSVVTSPSNLSNVTNTLSTSDLSFTVNYSSDFATVATKKIAITSVNNIGSSLTAKSLTLVTAMSVSSITGGTAFTRCDNKTFTAVALGAATYNWTVANGATIVSGQGTNTVVVDYSGVLNTVTTTPLKVQVTNSCGVLSAIKSVNILSTLCASDAKMTYTSSNATYNVTNIYPNPAFETFNANLDAEVASEVSMQIFSINGTLISERTISLEQGTNNITENVSEYSKGIYFVKFANSATNETIVKKLIKE